MRYQQIIAVFLCLSCFQQTVTGGVIVNGNRVPDGSMAYMASLQTLYGMHVCGGFLVSEQFVLTAAHCFDDAPTRVVLGNHNLRNAGQNGQIIEIEEKIKHPSYGNGPGFGNDLMLLKLKRNVELGNNVQIIQLPYTNMSVRPGDECQVAGWGATGTHGANVNELLATDVSIIDRDTCVRQWNRLPDNVICAGGGTTETGFCQGDSGGPLVCQNTAVGIVSFNKDKNCSYRDGVPNVFADITKYVEWILDTIAKNV